MSGLGLDRAGANLLDVTASAGFAEWLSSASVGIAFTVPSAGRLVLIGPPDEADPAGAVPTQFELRVAGPRAVHASGGALLLATRQRLLRFNDMLAPGTTADGYDRVYLPTVAYAIGAADPRDLVLGDDGTVLFANTLFSCLAATVETHSFRPVWRPPFVSALEPEDRCHLTGFAMVGGLPRFATIAAWTDQRDGWRTAPAGAGCLFDIGSGEPVVEGLTLPGSPRIYQGCVLLSDGGAGEMCRYDPLAGTVETVAFCPGYLTGLSVVGDHAVAAVSRTYEGTTFPDLPLAPALERYGARAQCAIVVVDLRAGDLVHWLRLEGPVGEIADVTVLHDCRRPAIIGFQGEESRRMVSIAPS